MLWKITIFIPIGVLTLNYTKFSLYQLTKILTSSLLKVCNCSMTKSNHWRTKWRFEQMSNNNNDAAIHLVLQIWLRGGDPNGLHDIWAHPVSGGKDHILVTWPTYHLMPFDTRIKNIHLLRVGTLTIFKISGHILFKHVRTSQGGYKEQEDLGSPPS